MWTIFLYVFTILCSVGQSTLTKLNSKKNGSAAAYNFLKSAGFLLILLAIFAFDRTANLPTLAYGAVFGCLLVIANLCGYYALQEGPMALTSMLVTFSLLLPYAYGVAALGETPSVPQIVGICLFFVSLVLIRSDSFGASRQNSSARISGKWALLTFATLIANGLSSIVQKLHQVKFPGLYSAEFTSVAGIVNCIVFGILFLIALMRAGHSSPEPVVPSGSEEAPARHGFRNAFAASLILGGLAGVLNGTFNFTQLRLAATEDASILYPVISAGVMLCVFLTGRLFFKEKMNRLQTLGFAVGVSAVILLKL